MISFLRSRMFSPAFRLFAGISAFTLVSATAFAMSTNGRDWWFDRQWPFIHIPDTVSVITGPISLGWKGYVGNHVGYVVLVAMAVVSAGLAGMLVAFRDADPDAEAQVVQMESVPLTRAPAGASYWPVIGAFAAAMVIVGLVSSRAVFYAGVGLLIVTIAVWTVRNWAYRATGDDEVNHELYHSFIDPLRIPVLGVLCIGIVVAGLSRVLLAAPDKTTSIWIFGVAGLVFFLAMVGLAFSKTINRNLIAALLVIAALAFIGAAIGGAVAGEREFHPHSNGGAETETPASGGGEHGIGELPSAAADAPSTAFFAVSSGAPSS